MLAERAKEESMRPTRKTKFCFTGEIVMAYRPISKHLEHGKSYPALDVSCHDKYIYIRDESGQARFHPRRDLMSLGFSEAFAGMPEIVQAKECDKDAKGSEEQNKKL